jgi:hypothetical protein
MIQCLQRAFRRFQRAICRVLGRRSIFAGLLDLSGLQLFFNCFLHRTNIHLQGKFFLCMIWEKQSLGCYKIRGKICLRHARENVIFVASAPHAWTRGSSLKAGTRIYPAMLVVKNSALNGKSVPKRALTSVAADRPSMEVVSRRLGSLFRTVVQRKC